MKLRHFAAWFSGVALLGTGATLLFAQAPQPVPQAGPVIDRAKLRAEVIKLRTEVEMLRFDYELRRDNLLEELKMARGMKMAGGLISAFSQMTGDQPEAVPEGVPVPVQPPDGPPVAPLAPQVILGPRLQDAPVPRQKTAQERKKEAELKVQKAKEEAKVAELEDKKFEAELAAQIAVQKKELSRLFDLLSAKRLDLEDAERSYRESSR